MSSIWVIEDNDAYRRATVRALRSRPDISDISEFRTCEAALKRLESGQRPAVALLDIGLPGIDGIEGIRRIKRFAPEVGIVVLSVFEDDEKIFQAVCAGACGYLLKSQPLGSVLTAIEEAKAGGAPMNPQVAHRVLAMLTRAGARSAPAAEAGPADTASRGEGEDPGLSERERRVLELMVEGLGKKEIAARIQLNLHTVDYVMRCIYRKLHVNCLAAAVRRALRDGIVPR